jgi:hypothetical protein
LRIEPLIGQLLSRTKLWKRFQKESALLDNHKMNSITTMELQENSFRDLRSLINNCNLVRLQLLDGSSRELTSPTLGREFLAGDLEDEKTLGVFRRSIFRSVQFETQIGSTTRALEYTRKAIGELLASRQFPALAQVSYLEPRTKPQQLRLIGISRGFLFTDYLQSPAIPIAALGSVELGV